MRSRPALHQEEKPKGEFSRLPSKKDGPEKCQARRHPMPKRINNPTLDFLAELADYRILSLSQIAVLRFGSKRSARRRMQELLGAGLVEVLPIRAGREAGRPEKVYGLSVRGYQELDRHGRIPKGIPDSLATGQNLVPQGEHQILLNWGRVHLVLMARNIPRVEVKVLSSNSPLFWLPDEGRSLLSDEVEMGDDAAPQRFCPDAAFTITDTVQAKTVLFLLEVDRGTEPLRGGDPARSEIESKIRRYQEYFHTKRYKRYEKIFEATLNGFRLLFLTTSSSRLSGLCSLVRGNPPSDFIWLTTKERMHLHGISGFIWSRGGRIEGPRESILGNLARDLPHPVFEV